MKKILTALAISFSALMTSNLIYGAPHDRNYDRTNEQKSFRSFKQEDDEMQEVRREREQRGVRRLQQHRWQQGYVMPQHYRGDSYKVGYRENNLPKPSRNQQWYKINNDYILIDSSSNSIIQIQGM